MSRILSPGSYSPVRKATGRFGGKPYHPPPYLDEDEGGVGRKSSEPESRTLIYRYNRTDIPKSERPWHDSEAYSLLDPDASEGGIWIPNWVGKAVGNARQARLTGWLLWWFEDESAHSGKRMSSVERVTARKGLCRARGRGEHGDRALVTTWSRLARETGMPRKTVDRNLRELVGQNLFVLEEPKTGRNAGKVVVYPEAVGMAKAWAEAVRDAERLKKAEQCKSMRDVQKRLTGPAWKSAYPWGWYDSEVSRLAMNRNPARGEVVKGTYVYDLLFAACEGKPGPAWLLSQVLWWFRLTDRRRPGKWRTRVRIVRDGHLWMAESPRGFERDLGVSEASVREWLDYLTDDRKLLVKGLWVYDRRIDRGERRTHLRPDVEQLEKILFHWRVRQLADRLTEAKLPKDGLSAGVGAWQ